VSPDARNEHSQQIKINHSVGLQ